ncbi:hypothetical protein [Leisingera sp. JC1]|uniref:hypothetical protein n=1 Tax=Leisingera sp. JC1 TaxID=1855282 RepID=UPI000803B9E4|nr:hypothetical protein [Leisingera sp. JC1]OBY26053.1 hypothetical protein A9D60_20090 [Leisingera sp. JC1]
MRVHVLDKFNEGDSEGVLCRVSFTEYLKYLPEDFRQYFVQRGITSNRYLDNLWETIVEKKHIPLIVLVASPENESPGSSTAVQLGSGWKILDGLQRTHRMKLIFDVVQYLIESVDEELDVSGVRPPISKVVREHKDWLLRNDCPSSLFVKVLRSKRSMSPEDFSRVFDDVNLWLEVWFGLSENEQIQKMLILNAGHKSVNIKHQIELLFSDYLEVLKGRLGDGRIIRERDKSSISYSKSREVGQFHFSHLVTAFQSLDAGKPISTNSDFAAEKSLSMSSGEDNKLEINVELLEAFAEFLRELDAQFREDDLSVKWLGREVVLAGVFGAIGRYSSDEKKTKIEVLGKFKDGLKEFSAWLDLERFEAARNALNLAKVNIGNKNKLAVSKATLSFLRCPSGPSPDWKMLFDGERLNDI